MAAAGQPETQAPQPVQRSARISGTGTVRAGAKRIADAPQASRQLKHTTPLAARQLSSTSARSVHGAWSRDANRPTRHADAQSPQKLHSPREGSNTGSAPAPRTRTCSVQAAMQSPQPVQASAKRDSSSAQGGRGTGTSRNRPRSSDLRLAFVCAEAFTGARSAHRRTGWAGNHLVYPDRKAITAYDHHR